MKLHCDYKNMPPPLFRDDHADKSLRERSFKRSFGVTRSTHAYQHRLYKIALLHRCKEIKGTRSFPTFARSMKQMYSGAFLSWPSPSTLCSAFVYSCITSWPHVSLGSVLLLDALPSGCLSYDFFNLALIHRFASLHKLSASRGGVTHLVMDLPRSPANLGSTGARFLCIILSIQLFLIMSPLLHLDHFQQSPLRLFRRYTHPQLSRPPP